MSPSDSAIARDATRSARVLALIRGGVKAVPVSAGLTALLQAAREEEETLPPDLARELPRVPPERLEHLARRAMAVVPESDRRGLEREARKLIGLGPGERRSELVRALATRLVKVLAGPIATDPGSSDALPVVEEPEQDEVAAPPPEPTPKTPAPKKPAKDPFAEDPLAEASPLDPSSVPAVDENPFSSRRRKAKEKAEEQEKQPEPAKDAQPPEPAKPPETEKPTVATAPKPVPEKPPEAEKAKPKKKAKDPFANDPLAEAAPIDLASAPRPKRDPFADELIAPVDKSRKSDGLEPKGRRRGGPPPPAIKFASKKKEEAKAAPPPPKLREVPPVPALDLPAPAAPPTPAASPAAPAPAAPGAPAAAASSTPAPPAPTAPPPESGGRLRAMGMAAAAAAVLLALGGVGWAVLRLYSLQQDRAKRDFLDSAAASPLEQALSEAEALPPGLLEDPEIAAEVKRLKGLHAQRRRRTAAEQVLEQVPAGAGPEERLKAVGVAIATDDTFSRAYVERARLRQRQSRRLAAPTAKSDELEAARKAAFLDLGQALEHEPGFAVARYLRARWLIEARLDSAPGGATPKGDLSEVVQLASRAAGGVPPELGALAEGWLHLLAGEPRVAVECFGRGAAEPGDARRSDATAGLDLRCEGHLGRAIARLRMGESRAALEDASAAVGRDAGSSEALLVRARARLNIRREQPAAKKDVERALELDRLSVDGWALKGLTALDRDRDGRAVPGHGLDEARRASDRALALDRTHPLALAVRALVEAAGRKPALELADQAVAVAGFEAEPFFVRALLLDDPRRALADVEAALARAPDHLFALVRAGALLVEQSEGGLARARLDQALRVDPDCARALYYRGVVAMKDRPRDLTGAVQDFDRAITLDANLADAWLMRAAARADLDQHELALADLDKLDAVRAHLTIKTAYDRWLIAGNCLFALHKWERARDAYRKFLDQAPTDTPWASRANKQIELCRQRLGAGNREY